MLKDRVVLKTVAIPSPYIRISTTLFYRFLVDKLFESDDNLEKMRTYKDAVLWFLGETYRYDPEKHVLTKVANTRFRYIYNTFMLDTLL